MTPHLPQGDDDRSIRLRRLFRARSGRCLDVAVDHGFFGEGSFLTGIEDLPAAVATLADAGPDAIQLTVGQARLLQRSGDSRRPALVLRTDVANVYGTGGLPDHMYSLMLPEPGLTAVRLDAACLVVNLFDLPGRPQVREACIANVLKARVECDRYNMPLMVEPLVMRESAAGAYAVDAELTGWLDAGDIDEALAITEISGDPPGTAWNDPRAHGTGDARMDSFLTGYDAGITGCDLDLSAASAAA